MQKLDYLYPNMDPVPPSLATKTDSVIRHMQYKIDSLAKASHDTEIRKDFFSDALSQNLYTYAIIIGFFLLINWGWVEVRIRKHKKSVKKLVKTSIKSQSEASAEKNEHLQQQLFNSIFDIRRAMHGVTKNGNKFTAFKWAIAATRALIDTDYDEKPDKILMWVKVTSEALNNVPKASYSSIKNEYGTFDEYIREIIDYEESTDEIKNLAKNIKDRYMMHGFGQTESDYDNVD